MDALKLANVSHIKRPTKLADLTVTFLTDTLRDEGWTPFELNVQAISPGYLGPLFDVILADPEMFKLSGNTIWIRDPEVAVLFILQWS